MKTIDTILGQIDVNRIIRTLVLFFTGVAFVMMIDILARVHG